MKHVSDFVNFDFGAWASGKEFELRGVYDRTDKETGTILGKTCLLVITKDDCKNYKLRENEQAFSLAYEKIYVSCGKVSAQIGQKVTFEKPFCNVGAKGLQNGSGFLTVYFNCAEIKKL